jgi:hypothetical protein
MDAKGAFERYEQARGRLPDHGNRIPDLRRVPVKPTARVVMVGDTLHTDIPGGAGVENGSGDGSRAVCGAGCGTVYCGLGDCAGLAAWINLAQVFFDLSGRAVRLVRI